MKKNCLSCGVRFVHGENLDVVRTSGDQESREPQGFPHNRGGRGVTASFGPSGPVLALQGLLVTPLVVVFTG